MSPEDSQEPAGPHPAAGSRVPVVAIGASAGGLKPLRELLEALPADTGLAVVVLQHLEPTHPSLLGSVLSGVARMPVVEAAHGMPVEANRVYVMSSSADLGIEGRTLSALPRRTGPGGHHPIDRFFLELSQAPGRAIGVVLSGTGTDGTEGLRAIKAAGGLSFAQAPDTAEFTGMPVSAISAGVVDRALAPSAIAAELARLGAEGWLTDPEVPPEGPSAPSTDPGLDAVLGALRRHVRQDFSSYKRPTLRRRIARRMALLKVSSPAGYAELVGRDPTEARALADDLLIHVTSFFRDPDAFAALEEKVLAEVVRRKSDQEGVRVWVPGCSTGEEAYSIAIALLDLGSRAGRHLPIRVFGTDLSEAAIQTARAGVFGGTSLLGVSPERLARYFEPAEGRFRVSKDLREVCVFVKHDLARDPPFAKLDLISCRNVLIYFDADLQRRVLALLHHCLLRPGYLFLGTSEGVGPFGDLFAPVDARQRIFLKIGEGQRLESPATSAPQALPESPMARRSLQPSPMREAQRKADHLLLARYAPPGVIVDERLEIVQFRGRTGPFLEPAPGQPQAQVLRMARAGLLTPLREALEEVRGGAAQARREGVRVEDGPVVDLGVTSLPLDGLDPARRFFLVVFEEAGGVPRSILLPQAAEPDQAGQELARVRAELAYSRERLQSILGEHQDTTDALAAANEELISANGELQATNEELQSAKEELQAANEELSTLNDELRVRNRELDVVARDLVHVLESVQVAVILVDEELRVRRFTPSARGVSTLAPGDLGRPVEEVKFTLDLPDVAERIRDTLAVAAPREWEVRATDGRWFRMAIRPFLAADGRTEGAVLSFIDVDALKRVAQEAERARDDAERLVQTVPTPVVVLDGLTRVVKMNPAFLRTFGLTGDLGSSLFELSGGAWRIPALVDAVELCLSGGLAFGPIHVRCASPTAGSRDLVVLGVPLVGSGSDRGALIAMEDVTERRMLEQSERQARDAAEQANRAKDLFLATLSHELRTPLGSILMAAQLLQRLSSQDARVQQTTQAIIRAVANQTRLIDDLLDISRIVSGKLVLDLQPVDLAAVVLGAVEVARASADAKGLALDVSVDPLPGTVRGDPVRLQQVMSNLLDNAIKFTGAGGRILVRLWPTDHHANVTVSDTGVGIEPGMLPRLFDRFVQAESSMTRTHGGLGLGLAIVAHLVGVHGGEVRAESPGGGQGSTFTVTLPLNGGGAPTRELSTHPGAVGLGGLGVLLVEDDDDTRQVTAALLAQLGAEVRTAASADEGLAALGSFLPRVILCDLAMPGKDGFAFIRALRGRSADQGGRIPAAALTALAGEDDRRQALEAGFQEHLSKPIDASRLASSIRRLSDRAALDEGSEPPRRP